MNKSDFLQNLSEYSQAKGFSLLTAAGVVQDPKQVSTGQRIAVSAIGAAVGGIAGGPVVALICSGVGLPGYYESRKQELISDLERLSPYGDLIGINLSTGIALLRVAIDADNLTEDALVGRFSLIHERAFDFRKYASLAVASRMETAVEVLVIFSTHERARDFTERLAGKCKHATGFFSGIGGRVHTDPWVVDLEREEIASTRKGIWKLPLGFQRGDHRAALFRNRSLAECACD